MRGVGWSAILRDVSTLPGTLWINRGRWNWRVRLPGAKARTNHPLRIPRQRLALSASKPRSLAESLAWRIWEQASKAAAATSGKAVTVDEACARFLVHAQTYYRRLDGSPTREAANCEIALRSLRRRFGARDLNELTAADLLSARDELVAAGLYRATINQRVGIWRRFFAWALDERICDAATKAEAWAVGALKPGRSAAPEPGLVDPVPHRIVKATLRHLPPSLQTMIRVQELCGARPSEMCAMRVGDVERRRDVWVYRPADHKTLHKGGVRVIVLGPRAQRLLEPMLTGGVDEYVFSPRASIEERARGRGKPGERWTASNYGQAIRYAVRAARRAGESVPNWSPNQLRHSCGTRVRRRFGPAVAGIVLGHSQTRQRVTDIYTRQSIERETVAAARSPMLVMG